MALFLRQEGYQAFAIKGGYQAWKAAGYPTVPKQAELAKAGAGVCPVCHEPMAAHRV